MQAPTSSRLGSGFLRWALPAALMTVGVVTAVPAQAAQYSVEFNGIRGRTLNLHCLGGGWIDCPLMWSEPMRGTITVTTIGEGDGVFGVHYAGDPAWAGHRLGSITFDVEAGRWPDFSVDLAYRYDWLEGTTVTIEDGAIVSLDGGIHEMEHSYTGVGLFGRTFKMASIYPEDLEEREYPFCHSCDGSAYWYGEGVIAAVPEASTNLLMLGGLVTLAGAVNLRRRRPGR